MKNDRLVSKSEATFKTFYYRLQDVIEALGISKKAFAQAAGITESTLSGYLNGTRNPKQETIAKWIHVFDVNPYYLLLKEGEPLGRPKSQPMSQITQAVASIEESLRAGGASEELIWRTISTLATENAQKLVGPHTKDREEVVND